MDGHTLNLLLSHPNPQFIQKQKVSPREVDRNIYLLVTEQVRIRSARRLEVATKGKVRVRQHRKEALEKLLPSMMTPVPHLDPTTCYLCLLSKPPAQLAPLGQWPCLRSAGSLHLSKPGMFSFP